MIQLLVSTAISRMDRLSIDTGSFGTLAAYSFGSRVSGAHALKYHTEYVRLQHEMMKQPIQVAVQALYSEARHLPLCTQELRVLLTLRAYHEGLALHEAADWFYDCWRALQGFGFCHWVLIRCCGGSPACSQCCLQAQGT